MDFNQIKELIKIVDASSITDFNFDYENLKLSIIKRNDRPISYSEAPAIINEQVISAVNKATIMKELDEPTTIIPERKPVHIEGNVIEAPLVGTFYRSASPDKPPYVEVGARVKKGDVLCIIEAMKVMNEIISKYDGTVTEILADNEAMVEYGQPLFIIS